MSNDDKYYVPVRAEDECLNTVVDKLTEVLGQNLRLESIFQKYNKDYNTTFTESVSVKTLQVGNQNHKPMFSSITATGMIRSPFSSSVSLKKGAKEQHRRQLKRSRLGFSTERKRLSFDEPDDSVRTNVSQNTWIDSQQLPSDPIQSNSTPLTVITDEEMDVSHLDQNETFLGYLGEKETSDIPHMYNLQNFNPLGKPETVTSNSVYEQDEAYSVDKTPDKHQPTVITSEENSKTNLNCNISESRRSNLENSPKFRLKTASTASSHFNANRNGIFSLDEALGAIISLQLQEKDTKFQPTKTSNISETIFTSYEKMRTPIKNTAVEKSRDKYTITNPLRFSFGEQVRNSNQLPREPSKIQGNQESLTADEKPEVTSIAFPEFKQVRELEISSSLSNEYKATASTSYETSDISKALFRGEIRKEKTPINSIVVETVAKATSNKQEFLIPKEDDSMTHNPKVNKRKPVDLSEETIMHTCLVAEDKKSFVSAKIAKLNDKLLDDNKTTISPTVISTVADRDTLNSTDNSSLNDKFAIDSLRNSSMHKKSFNLADDSTINDKESFHSVDGTDINDKESFIHVDDSLMDTKESFNPVDDSLMDTKESLNPVGDTLIDKGSYAINESSAEVSSSRDNELRMDEMTPNSTDTPVKKFASSDKKSGRKMNDSTHYHDPKLLVRNISSEKDLAETTSPHEAGESSSNTVQDVSPSLKRSFDGRTQKLTTEKSDNDNTSPSRDLCLQGKLSETTPPRDVDIQSPKPESIHHTQKDEFCKLVIQTKNRMFTYRKLFLEDKHDVHFICSYLKQITGIVEIISDMQYESELVPTIDALAHKAFKLSANATSWEYEVVTDLKICYNCYKKVKEIQQELEQIGNDKSNDLSAKDFERWENCLRAVNKKAGDVMLLRDVRRPTILQFGHKIESMIQFFINCLLVLGMIKPYSEVSFN